MDLPGSRLPRGAGLVGLALALAWTGATGLAAAPRPDPAGFFERLESIGLATGTVREVAREIDIVSRSASRHAEASYGFFLNNIYVPGHLSDAGGRRIRFDLEPGQLNTLIHEFVHAAYDVHARETAPVGSPAREHWEATNSIWADLYLDPRHETVPGIPRYPGMKADEVTAYFLADAIAEVFETADAIVLINTHMVRHAAATPAEARALGDTLVIPAGTGQAWIEAVRTRVFGELGAGNDHAYFEGEAIPWDERRLVKQQIYRHVLGLNPPADAAELLADLNTIDNPWIRDVRRQVVAAREAFAQELEGGAPTRVRAARGEGPEAPGAGLFGSDGSGPAVRGRGRPSGSSCGAGRRTRRGS